ncbi:putative geraniol 8-hydroxylase [Helianthus annuus]|nr:putative geraniol 8-hydroxylase [Helianthus annuus]
MELLYLIITSIISFFFLLHVADVQRKRRLPPGPLRLPIIGNLHQLLGPKPHKTLATLAKKHGPLMTIQLGNITTVVASTPEAAREILLSKDEVCSSRPVPDAVTALKHHDMAILWIPPNVTWQTHRKVLRMYLTSQHKLDTLKNVRETVVEEMLDYIRVCARKKTAVDIGMMGFAFSLNQLAKTFFSQNMTSYEPEDIRRFQEVVETAMEMMGKLNIVDMFPVLKPFDPQNVRRRAKEAFVCLEEMVEASLNERVKHRDSNLPRFDDVLDSMLDYSEENEDEFSLKHIKTLLMVLLTLFVTFPPCLIILVNILSYIYWIFRLFRAHQVFPGFFFFELFVQIGREIMEKLRKLEKFTLL